jgi:hypothetical protein
MLLPTLVRHDYIQAIPLFAITSALLLLRNGDRHLALRWLKDAAVTGCGPEWGIGPFETTFFISFVTTNRLIVNNARGTVANFALSAEFDSRHGLEISRLVPL